MTTSAIAALTSSDIAVLTTTQVSALTSAQIDAPTIGQLTAFTNVDITRNADESYDIKYPNLTGLAYTSYEDIFNTGGVEKWLRLRT